ncbi:MAG: hypothetical protein AMXMBFR58_10710 [Phycisphaerae bacterium]
MKGLLNRVLGRSRSMIQNAGKARSGRGADRVSAEQLEPRALLAVFTVINVADAGAGSLRQAILDANAADGADVIEFDAAVNGVITLADTGLIVTDSVAINGPGASLLRISGNDAVRVMEFTAGTSSLSGVTIGGGNAFNGAGVRNSGTLTITGSRIINNSATVGGGGGIENLGTLTLVDSTVASNDGGIGDGGAVRNGGTLTIRSSTISGNNATGGGGIANFGVATTITNSTIANNTASLDGAAIINFNALTVSNSTIAGNTGAPAITNSGALTLHSSIIGGAPTAPMVGTFAAGSANNLIQHVDNSGGLGNDVNGNLVGVDPLLGALADNGGPTQTIALQPGSPAINAGSNTGGLTTDQRGLSRVRGNAIDIGAFEYAGVPTVGSLTPSAAFIARGQTVTLTANNVSDTDGTITRVDFYLDADGDGVADAGELIGSDDNADGGYTLSYQVPLTVTLGSASLLAVAVDSDTQSSTVVSAPLTVLSESLFAAAPDQLIGASAGTSGNINVTIRNAQGFPVVMQKPGSSQEWTGSNLQTKAGSPPIVGEVVTWVDAKDGLSYAAAMTTEGLVVFKDNSGTWTYTNLSILVPGTPAITGNLTTFNSIDNMVSIAGVAANGDLIRYYQTGTAENYAWTAVNHGQELRDQGLTMPQFTGRITSFVTPWNALNVVGLDANGDIQAVWWHQSLATAGKWTTNNLSDQTGAAALTGGLTVWLTSWNAINIAGTDTDGKLSATWWVPGYNNEQWNNDNLTDIIGGPLLEANSMTSWTTSWGAMNIAGRETDGTISVYWWVPGFNNDQWNVAYFRDVVPNATHTVGPVTGLSAPGGDQSMSMISSTEGGEVIRLWWNPATDVWSEQNLTQITQEV